MFYFSRTMLMRKVHGHQLRGVHLRAADYFVLDLMAQNLDARLFTQVLELIEKKIIAMRQQKVSNSSTEKLLPV